MLAGRVKRVHILPRFYFINPLGAVKRKANGLTTGWCRIHDLSFPPRRSVNDGIREEYGTLLYQTFDDAIDLIAKHGRNIILRKRDLKEVFA